MADMTPKDVIDYFGGQTSTALALGIKPHSVFGWIEAGEVPECRQYQIEMATGGKLRASKPALRVTADEYRQKIRRQSKLLKK